MKLFTVLLFQIIFITAAHASPGNPDHFCRNGSFPREEIPFKLATVKTTDKVYFNKDDEGCPSTSTPQCNKKAYLINGDVVIVSRVYQNFICSWFEPKKMGAEETVGWLPLSSVNISDDAAIPSLNQWVGEWKDGKNSIKLSLSPDGSTLKAIGEAFWIGLNDNIHTGNLAGSGKPNERLLKISEEGEGICQAQFFLVGSYLVVSDNNECGGMNVSFSGIYKK